MNFLLMRCIIIFSTMLFSVYAMADTARVEHAKKGLEQIVIKSPKQNSTDSAQQALEKLIVEHRAKKNLSGEAKAIFYLSSLLTKKGLYTDALFLINSIINKQGDSKLDSLKPHLYAKLSAVNLYLGDYRSAITAIEKAQSYSMDYIPYQININVLTSNVWAKLPDSYQPEGYRKALGYLNKANSLARIYNSKMMYSFTLNNIADLYLKLGQFDKCKTNVEEAIAVASSIKNEKILQLSLITLAELKFKENDVTQAMVNLKKALSLKSDEADGIVAIEGYLLLSKIYIQQHQYYKARQTIMFIENTLIEQNDKARLLQVYQIKSDLYLKLGNFEQSLEYYKKYKNQQEEILSREVAYEVKNLELLYKETEKDKALLESKLNMQKQSQQLQRKNFLLVLLGIVLVLVILIVLFFYGRHRQREQLDKQQLSMERLRAVIQGEELERSRIAKELHDGIGGMLAVIGMQFSAAVKDSPIKSEHTAKIQELLKSTSDEVRKTAHNLLPTALELNNLAHAVQAICNEIANTSNLMVDVETQGDFSKLDITFSIAVFRIIQELFHNIIKHAQATHTVVILELIEDKLSIHIEDNGNGFNVHELPSSGMGIKNIRERVNNFGGSINIQSVKSLGTTVSILFKNIEKQAEK